MAFARGSTLAAEEREANLGRKSEELRSLGAALVRPSCPQCTQNGSRSLQHEQSS